MRAEYQQMHEPLEAEPDMIRPTTSPSWRRHRNLLGWSLVGVLLGLQFLLFRQSALREVVWSYPPYHDQLSYLGRSYDTYERILDRGIWAGLSEAEGFRHFKPEAGPDERTIPGHQPDDPNPTLSPNGAFLPVQAALLFLLTGPGRLAALSMNFAYLALFQCAVIATVLWFTGRWSLALLALGLLLSSPSQFDATGGIIDFRIDFIAMCLYGIFVCLAIRSKVFADWRWSALAGFVGAVVIGFRFIASIYLAGVMGFLLIFLAAKWLWLRHKPIARQAVFRQIVGAAIACAIILLLAGPLIVHHFPAINDYYIGNHLKGTDRGIRAASQGVRDIWDSLKYYPNSLYDFHAGPFFCKAGGLLLLVCIAVRAFGPRRDELRSRSPIDLTSAVVFAGLCLFVPLVLLSTDQDKTPVVADVMVGPLLWLIVLIAAGTIVAFRGRTLHPLVRYGLAVFATIVLTEGMLTQFSQYPQRGEMSKNRDQIESLERLYDRIDADCHAIGLRNPIIASDTQSDYIVPGVLQVLSYERHGHLIRPGECMANTIAAVSADDLLKEIRQADFVLLTDHEAPPSGQFEYPFETSVRQAKPRLLAYCRENLVEQGRARVFDRDVTLYARPMLGGR
jgi:hypothetical protein